jgi:hypothetical protein
MPTIPQKPSASSNNWLRLTPAPRSKTRSHGKTKSASIGLYRAAMTNALRQQRKMSLGDATIAATAIVHQLPIATHNVTDFQWVPNLIVIDPLTP